MDSASNLRLSKLAASGFFCHESLQSGKTPAKAQKSKQKRIAFFLLTLASVSGDILRCSIPADANGLK